MRNLTKLTLLIAVSCLSFPVGAVEALGEADELTLSISLAKPVHFNDSEGNAVLVPAGTYWVFPEEENLMLVGHEAIDIFTLVATTEESGEENPYPTATSVPNAEGEPDIHYIVFTSTTGQQIVAEGSYSGVKPRGFLGDKAKKAAAAARRRAQENARIQAAKRRALENERLRQVAQQAQSLIEQAKSLGQEKALKRAQYLMMDLANTVKNHGEAAARQKLRTYLPELAVLFPIAVPPKTQLELSKQAAIFVRQNRRFIAEVAGRIANSQTIQQHIANDKGLAITRDEAERVVIDIMGRGDNALQLPFVATRGLEQFSGPSISFGGSVGGGVLGHGAVGAALALSLTNDILTSERSFAPMFCVAGSAGVTFGPVADLSGSIDIGFWQASANNLGLNVTSGVRPSAMDALMAIRIPVKISLKVGGGVAVRIKFAPRNPELLFSEIMPYKIAGFSVGPSFGAGGGASVGLAYSVTACPQELIQR